jgi:hypothetical protein
MDKDSISTIAGGTAGLALMASVQWSAIPHGEIVKVGIALLFAVLGIWHTRRPGSERACVTHPKEAAP